MRSYLLDSTNPYFNLATEEYLLKNCDDDICLIWQNKNTLVVGKHQNTLAEINYKYVRDFEIPVVRRLSGGGTVFHDLGNINFTFISNKKSQNLIDFRHHTKPIFDALNHFDIPVYYSPRNDLFIEGYKVSGNAEHIYQQKKRVLHHGTLLFDSDLNILDNALKSNEKAYTDKSVKSVRSKVSNLKKFTNLFRDTENFKNELYNFIVINFNTTNCKLSEFEIIEIKKLEFEKYRTWEWNFGYSPSYFIKNCYKNYHCEMNIAKGKIEQITLYINNEKLNIDNLIGKYHIEQTFFNLLEEFELKISKQEIYKLFF